MKEASIKIVSNGTSMGTYVEVNGERLKYVSRIEWEVSPEKPHTIARITLIDVPIEIEGEIAKEVITKTVRIIDRTK